MMERKNNIIIALLGIWFLSMVGVFLLVNSYIDNQRTELRDDLRDGVKALFENQDDADVLVTDGDGFYDTAFSNHQVRHYKPTENPLRPKTPVKATKLSSSSIDKKVLDLIKDADEQLKQQYGDLQAIYELNWGDQFLNEYDEGWNIIRIYCSDNDNENFIQTNTIFPYKVGLRKSEFGNTFTVQDAVDGAYQFFTTNERSFISNRYQKDSNRRIWDDIYDCCNKYYTIVRNDNPTIQSNGTPISQPKGMSYDVAARKMPYELTSMQNGFYRVFIAATQPTTYKIQEDKEMVDKDRNNLFYGGGYLCPLFFLYL